MFYSFGTDLFWMYRTGQVKMDKRIDILLGQTSQNQTDEYMQLYTDRCGSKNVWFQMLWRSRDKEKLRNCDNKFVLRRWGSSLTVCACLTGLLLPPSNVFILGPETDTFCQIWIQKMLKRADLCSNCFFLVPIELIHVCTWVVFFFLNSGKSYCFQKLI